jgi:hypothetical protein
MIQETTCYKAYCDGCNERLCDEGREGFTLFGDMSQLEMAIDSEEWHRDYDSGKCYCPDCHSINDNDELVLKGKAIATSTKQ